MISPNCPKPAEINLSLGLRIVFNPTHNDFTVVEHSDTALPGCRDSFGRYLKERVVIIADRDTALAVYRTRERELNASMGFIAPMQQNEA